MTRTIREDVPNARMRRNVEMVILNRVLETVVKKDADNPKPAITRSVVDRPRQKVTEKWNTKTWSRQSTCIRCKARIIEMFDSRISTKEERATDNENDPRAS